jgi:hypothetical protein
LSPQKEPIVPRKKFAAVRFSLFLIVNDLRIKQMP